MHPVDARMSDRALGHGQGLIVMFPVQQAQNINVGNKDISTVRAFFFKIAKHQEFYFRYTQLGGIDAGNANALDYDFLGDTGHGTGNDILRLENDDFKVYHIGIGLNSPDLRVYESLDPSNPNRAVDHSNQNAPDPTTGDQFGFYDSKGQDDRFDPPARTERLSIRDDSSGEFLQYGFFAENDVSEPNTDLEVVGKTYQLRPVQSRSEQEFMLEQHRLRQADRNVSMKVIAVQIGGIFPYELGQSLPGGWADLKDTISQDLTYGASGGGGGGGGSRGGSARSRPRSAQQ